MSIIECKNLSKYYGKHRGIENLSLEVQKGEIFGFLGPNGAGKTTTIRTLLGLLNKTSGEALVFGLDASNPKESIEIRKRVAYLPGELGLYNHLTSRQNLKHILSLYHVNVDWKFVENLAGRLELDLNKKVRELSKGNKQKIGDILVLAPDVDLYILDEPTSGLDPLMQNEFYRILRERKEQTGATVFLSSHLLPEVEKVANRVGIIREGALVEVATMTELRKISLKRIEIYTESEKESREIAETLPLEIVQDLQVNNSHLTFLTQTSLLPILLEKLNNLKSMIQDLEITSPDLEDIFLRYYESDNEATKGETR